MTVPSAFKPIEQAEVDFLGRSPIPARPYYDLEWHELERQSVERFAREYVMATARDAVGLDRMDTAHLNLMNLCHMLAHVALAIETLGDDEPSHSPHRTVMPCASPVRHPMPLPQQRPMHERLYHRLS